MSTLLTAQSISIHSLAHPLLKDASFTLNKGDRIGLIGDNGCGKSTLLKVLDGALEASHGHISLSRDCVMTRVEQHLPNELHHLRAIEAVAQRLPVGEHPSLFWQAEALLSEVGFSGSEQQLECAHLSGGQHTRLLLARALLLQPDLILLDEPSNHLDLPSILWLERFLSNWSGSFVLVSHDSDLLDSVTTYTWIMRNQTLYRFALPCTDARAALTAKDDSDKLRYTTEQKEIDRVSASAKRLAIWGKTYDNEDLSRKAKMMEKRAERLKDNQTEVTEGSQWTLSLKGDPLRADRLMEISDFVVTPAADSPELFHILAQQIRSGDRIALVGRNGCGKSSLLREIWCRCEYERDEQGIRFNPRVNIGYYDQTLKQLNDDDTLITALESFEPNVQLRKHALIKAGYAWLRHEQKVSTLSGGERARLLFVGLSLARYSLLMLDEPTNHLDMEGKAALAKHLATFEGGLLLVSHDRRLINDCCNRIWLIDNGELTEWKELKEIEHLLFKQLHNADDTDEAQTVPQHEIEKSSEQLLVRLVKLEQLLSDDLARKTKHQKPDLQAQWREEIARIHAQL